MLWTDEAVERLKRLALEGRSASVIAAALGAESRNAVIGKANRIGVKLGGHGRASVSGRVRAAACRASPGERPSGPDRSPVCTDGDVEVGEMRRVRLEDMREIACRWPLGDPRSGDFAYCGLAPAQGRSYCPGHHRMAYRSPNDRAQRGREEPRWPRPASWRLA